MSSEISLFLFMVVLVLSLFSVYVLIELFCNVV